MNSQIIEELEPNKYFSAQVTLASQILDYQLVTKKITTTKASSLSLFLL